MRLLQKHNTGLQVITRSAQRNIRGGALGASYVCAGDPGFCTTNLTMCNRYCRSNFGQTCRTSSFLCP